MDLIAATAIPPILTHCTKDMECIASKPSLGDIIAAPK
jgi:hypothetical protein